MQPRHDDRYDPEPDYDRPTLADEIERKIENVFRPLPVRPKCPGCGKYIFTETEAATYDLEGDAWHISCYDGTVE